MVAGTRGEQSTPTDYAAYMDLIISMSFQNSLPLLEPCVVFVIYGWVCD